MKNYSIADSVFEVNSNYSRLQNKTKELFFRCLQEGRDVEYFEAEIRKIWSNIDEIYLQEQILEYRSYVHELNTGHKKLDEEDKKVSDLVKMTGAILLTNQLFQKSKIKEYKLRVNSRVYKSNKEEYIQKLIPKYTNDIKPYYKQGQPKTRENLVRLVSPNTYNSMVYNTTLTKNVWIQTLNDGADLGIDVFYIPHHHFSCPYCVMFQEKPLTRNECIKLLGIAEEGATELLHPNCQCVLELYNVNTKLKSLNGAALEEQYHVKQKILSLTLTSEELQTDKRIYSNLLNKGYDTQALLDKTNNKIKKVNSSIKELQKTLPTAELRKEAVVR